MSKRNRPAANGAAHTTSEVDSAKHSAARRHWRYPAGVSRYAVPGDVPDDHPGMTPRVLAAIAVARLTPRVAHPITDADGPHQHHWQPILWWCRGCGAFDEE